jgi:hypothetical protein
MKNMKELQDLMDSIANWSDNQFGALERRAGMIAHAKKELSELANALVFRGGSGILEECADVSMLMLDILSHSGYTANDLINQLKIKLEINKNRKWGVVETDGSIEHIK